MPRVHIRTLDQSSTLCGSQGGSISLRHYQERPEHVASPSMCEACISRNSSRTTEPWAQIHQALGAWARLYSSG